MGRCSSSGPNPVSAHARGAGDSAAAAQPRPGSDLLRLLPYLLPYRVRWMAMVVIALASLAPRSRSR